jgi:8-oxo-dGTP pyrophosphatase MutT (NUDIX family)
MIRCGVAVFAMRTDSSFLLARRSKPGDGHDLWSVPGGAIEDGETWRDAATRELAEETTLSVPEPRIMAVTTAGGWLTIWTAGPLRGIVHPVMGEETSDLAWVTCGDLWKYELWKTHWSPLLDEIGGTVLLDQKLKGRNN